MEIKRLPDKLLGMIGKYKYAFLVLIIGLTLLLLPGKQKQAAQTQPAAPTDTKQQNLNTDALTEILQSIDGAGKVQVLLSTATGEETLYQTDTDKANESIKTETVIITDSQRSESGLIRQTNPPTYLGAIVVCQGADSPGVRLAITQAVSKITGLSTDHICVLKMK